MQKKRCNIVSYIASISVILFLLIFIIHFFSFNESFYKREHRTIKLNNQSISEYIGISDEQLDELTSFTLNYLNDSNTTLDKQMIIKGKLREVFTDDEKAHMVDVQKLSINSRYIGGLCLLIYICSLLYLYKNKGLKQLFLATKNVYKGLVIFLLILISWIVIEFNSFWNFFHHIFFAGNDLWLLDLSKDILIMIVPPEFFFHLVSVIVISFVVVLVIYIVSLYLLNKKVSYD